MSEIKTIKTFATTVPLAGSRVRLTSLTTGPGRFSQDIVISAKLTNVGNIYLGGSDVNSSNGFPIRQGGSISLNQLFRGNKIREYDLYNLYIDSDTNGNGVIVLQEIEES